jgi:alpha-beta hydrolase superfamily lysophospholipase
MFALAAVVLGGNAIVAAHAWRFTHFAVGGAKTANPETLSPGDRVLVALTGVVVPRPTLGRLPAEAGLSAASSIEAGVSTWNVAGAGRGTALLFHGYGGSKSDLLDEAAVLHSAGWTTLMVDFPGSGESPGNTTSLGWAEADIVAELAKAHQNDGPLVLFGKSMGSAAVLRAVGVLGARAEALVLENPYDRLTTTVGHRFEAMGLPPQPGAGLLVFWGGVELGFNGFAMNPVDFAANVHTPSLLLTGERDPRVHLAEVESIRASLAGPAEIVVFPGAGHVGLYSADAALWRSAVIGFLDREAPNDGSGLSSGMRPTP